MGWCGGEGFFGGGGVGGEWDMMIFVQGLILKFGFDGFD